MRDTGGTYYTFATPDGTELHEIYNTMEEAEAGAKEFTKKQVEAGQKDNLEKIVIRTKWARVHDDNGVFLFDLREKLAVRRVEND